MMKKIILLIIFGLLINFNVFSFDKATIENAIINEFHRFVLKKELKIVDEKSNVDKFFIKNYELIKSLSEKVELLIATLNKLKNDIENLGNFVVNLGSDTKQRYLIQMKNYLEEIMKRRINNQIKQVFSKLNIDIFNVKDTENKRNLSSYSFMSRIRSINFNYSYANNNTQPKDKIYIDKTARKVILDKLVSNLGKKDIFLKTIALNIDFCADYQLASNFSDIKAQITIANELIKSINQILTQEVKKVEEK